MGVEATLAIPQLDVAKQVHAQDGVDEEEQHHDSGNVAERWQRVVEGHQQLLHGQPRSSKIDEAVLDPGQKKQRCK